MNLYKFRFGLSTALILIFSFQSLVAQQFNDGPINLQVKVREVFVNYAATDEAVFGVGFAPDDITFKFWVRDAANLDAAAWVGGACLLDDFNPPGPSSDLNTSLFNYNYTGANVPEFFDLRMDAWEDESSDGILGFNCPGTRCDYATNFCCATIFGICAFSTSDEKRCNSNPFKLGMAYRDGNPCEWYDWGYVSGSCTGNKYTPRIESYWRYTKGTACNNAIDLGTLVTGTPISHFNSNICYSNNYPSSGGNDVFYSFTVSSAMGVNISLCGANGAQFDSYLYLLNPSCNLETSNDNGCGSQSEILTSICNPGTYYVVVDGATAAEQGTFTLTITEDPSLTYAVTMTKNDITCFGLTDGSASVVVTGGFPPYTYAWSTSSIDTFVTGLAAGAVSITVTDLNGCAITATETIIEPAQMAVNVVSIDVSCSGANDGSATATPSGGTLPYTYEWSTFPVQTLQTAILLTSGSYLVTITDAQGCTTTGSAVINSATTISATINSISNVSCFGADDGAIDVSASGGNGPYNYIWSNGDLTPAISGLIPGPYTVTIFDAASCNAAINFIITEPSLLTLAVDQLIDARCNGADDGAISIAPAGGTLPYTFIWSNGATTEDIIDVFAGTYTVTITDVNGCQDSINATVNEPTAISVTKIATNVLCYDDSTGAIDLTVNGGTPPYTYFWSNGSLSQNINTLPIGSYSAMILDDNGCAAFTMTSITEPTALDIQGIVTDVACNGDNSGDITLTVTGGVSLYTYLWTGGAITPNLPTAAAGIYSVTVTDDNQCTETASFTVNEPLALQASIAQVIDVMCNGDSSGIIDVDVIGGTLPYTFIWSSTATTADLINVAAGNYTLTVTDGNSCSASISGIVTEPAPLTFSITSVSPSCFGATNGSADLTVTGGTTPYTFLWSNGAQIEDLSGIGAGSYSVLIEDAQGCTDLASTILITGTNLIIDLVATDVDCYGNLTGAVDATVTGGTSPYTYLWTNGATSISINGIGSGSYTINVIDNDGCSEFATAEIGEPNPLVINPEAVHAKCVGDLGSAFVSVSGGASPFTYNWSNGANTSIADDLVAGTYTITVTDLNNCTETEDIIILDPTPLGITFLFTGTTCLGGDDGTITAIVTGGLPPYQYALYDDVAYQSSPDFTGLKGGDYSVLAMDANGCLITDNIIVTEPTGFTIESDLFVFVATGATDELETTLFGIDESQVDRFEWTPSDYLSCDDCPNPEVTPFSTTTYLVTVYSIDGCSDSTYVNVVASDHFDIYIPNVFSPNGDNVNDEFEIFDQKASAVFQMKIFDRWGELVFETNDIDVRWDGTALGKDAVPGVYIYYASGKYIDDEEFFKQGSVTILK